MKIALLTLLSLANVFMAKSQVTDKATFDFWIGTWDAYWEDSLRGTNTLTKTLNDFVIEENFVFNDKTFVGKSWSVYDPTKKTWQQTWVDDSGGYLVFTGGAEGDKVILNMTEPRIEGGKTIYMRMVFFHIKPDSFDWDWQSSTDQKKWESAWAIHYVRQNKTK